MKTPYDTITIADGEAARDRLLDKTRKSDPPVVEIDRADKARRAKKLRREYLTMVPDTTERND